MEIKTFLSLNCPECNEGQFRDKKSRDLHEKSRDLSNYEIFQHNILKSQSFKKKSSILVILCHAEHLFSIETVLKNMNYHTMGTRE
jgi:hypothetical protein